MAAYLTASAYLPRADVMTVSRLCYRGTPNAAQNNQQSMVSASALLTDSVLAGALGSASGRILAACVQGDRYTDSDLSSLSGNSQEALYALTADLTTCILWDRRGMAGANDVPQPAYYQRVHDDLERLRRGERMF